MIYLLRFLFIFILCLSLNVCTCEILLTVTFLVIVPIVALVIILLISLIDGFKEMINEYTWKQMVLGNIFLLLFCILKEYGKLLKDYYSTKIW
jgi:hypothetical protein